MPAEIERKFLVKSDDWRCGLPGVRMVQGYLCRDPNRTVRVRIAGDFAFMTVKGRTSGFSRTEIEFPLGMNAAEEMLGLCFQPLIEKTRFRVPYGGLTWEVDEFHGANEGLIIAEVEIPSEDTVILTPGWVGAEVSSDLRYTNSQLSACPFHQWPQLPARTGQTDH